MSHPSDDTLFALAVGGDLPEADRHARECERCAARLRRLRGGALAMSEAKRSATDLSWVRLDDVIAREAVTAAREIRLQDKGSRVSWLRPLGFGLTFAAAAAAAVVMTRAKPEAPTPVAIRLPSVTVPATATRRAVDATVLLSAGEATLRGVSDTRAVALTEGVPREGATLATAAGARAVLALQPGVTLDLRAESAASLPRLREGQATVSLDRGSLRLARADGAAEVTLRVGEWSVRTEGDVLARRELDVVRVVVLGGRASVQREGAAALTFMGPVTLELPAQGDARSVGATAEDALALDLSAFRDQGALLRVPPVDPAAVLSLGEGTVLPQGVTALRLAAARTLTARVGRVTYTLELGSGEVAQWRRLPVLASREPVSPRPSAVRAPALPAAPEPADPGLSPTQIQAVARAAGTRLRHCFLTCAERNLCGEDEGRLSVNVQTDGTATLGPVPASLEGARRCLEGEVGRFRGSPSQAPYAIAIGFNTRR